MNTEVISLLIAFAAVIIGPVVTYLITKKNLEFQFRTIVKEKWVDKLAEASHSFLSSTVEWIEKYRGIKDGSSKTEKPNQEIDRMFDTINSSIIKLQLLLDRRKNDQEAILEVVDKIKELVNNKLFDDVTIKSLRSNHDDMINKLNELFHQERTKMADTYRKNVLKDFWTKFTQLE